MTPPYEAVINENTMKLIIEKHKIIFPVLQIVDLGPFFRNS